MAEYGDGSDGEGTAAVGLPAAARRRVGSVVTAARAAAARGRRSGSGLLLDQPFPHRLHLGDPLLVAGWIDVRIGLRVGLQLLVLAGQVEEPAVRPEEHIGGVVLEPLGPFLPPLARLWVSLVVGRTRVLP